SFRRVNARDPVRIPAPAYNAWCEAAEAYQAGNAGFTTKTTAPAVDRTRVRIRNDSGTDLPRFAVLGVTGPLFTPTDNLAEFLAAPKLTGTTPDAEDHAGRFVILLEPIPADRIGWALAAGVVPVMVDMQTADDRFADVTDGEAGYLTSGGNSAARILWAEEGTGPKRAMVLLGGSGLPPSTCENDILRGDGEGGWVVFPAPDCGESSDSSSGSSSYVHMIVDGVMQWVATSEDFECPTESS
ncbi:MAG: hypothetical protein KKI02_00320, partial [Planctomycetes bacterium]|nr:hypothetical protein [Planctomycetota bacterium]